MGFIPGYLDGMRSVKIIFVLLIRLSQKTLLDQCFLLLHLERVSTKNQRRWTTPEEQTPEASCKALSAHRNTVVAGDSRFFDLFFESLRLTKMPRGYPGSVRNANEYFVPYTTGQPFPARDTQNGLPRRAQEKSLGNSLLPLRNIGLNENTGGRAERQTGTPLHRDHPVTCTPLNFSSNPTCNAVFSPSLRRAAAGSSPAMHFHQRSGRPNLLAVAGESAREEQSKLSSTVPASALSKVSVPANLVFHA